MRVLIIAEAGVNHNGNIEMAKKLIDSAAEAGADFVKFQTFKTEKLVNKSAQKAAYQRANFREDDDSQFNMLKRLELSHEMHKQLIIHCEKKQVQFLSTGFDPESIDFLESLNIPFFKIPSGEITNKPYLKHIAQKGKSVVMSTGMSTIEEIKVALAVLTDNGLQLSQITLLHCNTEYPTPMQDVNLKAMLQMKKEFGISIGYSDHTQGIEVPIAAVALGAKIIEKHFTLDRNLAGPDHKASLEPKELKSMVSAIRNIEQAIGGSGIKEPSPSEIKNKTVARKSIVAAKEIKKGEIFTTENLTVKRPGNGISPMYWDEIIGQQATCDYQIDDQLKV